MVLFSRWQMSKGQHIILIQEYLAIEIFKSKKEEDVRFCVLFYTFFWQQLWIVFVDNRYKFFFSLYFS